MKATQQVVKNTLLDGWVAGWNDRSLAGWMGGWMDWWMEAKAWVRIVTAIIKPKMACCFKFKFLTIL